MLWRKLIAVTGEKPVRPVLNFVGKSTGLIVDILRIMKK